ncbi:MAG: hypothetical protein ABI076_05365 [Acidobacteriaceae bacterium]
MKFSSTLSTFIAAGLLTGGLAFAQTTTLQGVVSDQMCGAQHMTQNISAAKCTRECVKMGSSYALVVGDKVYTLKGHSKELDALAGEHAVITGTVSGTNVDVASVAPGK